MLIAVCDFIRRVEHELFELVRELQEETGRHGAAEERAWIESLPALAAALKHPVLERLHVIIEYPLPACGMFADAILLGEREGKPAAVIVELKNWITRTDRPGIVEGLVERNGKPELHPSDQVRGYVDHCHRFHSAVHELAAEVAGCVLLTRDFITQPYRVAPNAELVEAFPIFTTASEDASRLVEFLLQRLTAPDPAFAEAFAAGYYRQQRGFIQQVARQILDAKSRPFVLLDNQRRALLQCRVAVRKALEAISKEGAGERMVLAVIGPPGSGKSAVAARLWAELSLMPDAPKGDLMFVTTSMSQNSNWTYLFKEQERSSRGVIRKASAYHPLKSLKSLRKIHGDDFLSDYRQWRDNLLELRRLGVPFHSGAQDKEVLISIVDEAHSLVNTERAGAQGPLGFLQTLGPQAYHIIRASAITVLFLDPEQGFRHKENTRLEDIEAWAEELGAGKLQVVDLTGVQFRAAGSVQYMDWLDSVVGGADSERNSVLASAWYVGPSFPAPGASDASDAAGSARRVIAHPRRPPFAFHVYDDPFSMESSLRAALKPGMTGRLFATVSRKWRTEEYVNPHDLPASKQDFYERCVVQGREVHWSRVWNCVGSRNKLDYAPFVQGMKTSRTSIDPLAEIGCPVAVRGFDFDYVGLLWLEDLVWADGQWKLNLDFVEETGLTMLVRQARKERGEGPITQQLLRKVKQAYRILLSRALMGAFIWVKDPQTREHLRRSLAG